MSKNLTRKGLALGAIVALGSSLFAGTPASAATAITLDTAFGTSGATQNGVLGEYFTLASSLTAGTTGDKLKFKVEGATAANLLSTSRSTVSLTATGASSYTASTVAAVDTYAVSTIPVVDNNAKIATVIPVAYTAGQFTQVAFGLGSAVTDTTTLKITPFIDNGVTDNLITAGELTGTPISITFHKLSTVTATPTISAISTGSAVTAVVALNNGINVEQLRAQANGAPVDASKIGVKFLYNGTAQAETPVLWDTTDKAFQAKAENAVTGKIYGATGVVNGTDSVSATSGTSSAATNILTTGALSLSGAQYRATDSAAPGTTTQVVRAGAGTVTAEFDVATVATGKLLSGQKVSFTIHEADVDSLDAGASITAGGKTLTNSSTLTRQSITVDVITDADGAAILPISYSGLKNNNTVRVFGSYVASGGALTTVPASSTVANTAGFLLTGEDSLAVKLVNEDKSSNAAAVSRVAKGGSLSLPFVLVDQFGMTPVGTYRATVTNAGNASTTSPVAVSDGKFSVSLTDNSTADNNAGYTVTAQIQKLGTNGVTYTDVSGVTESHKVSIGAVTSGSTITLGSLGSATPAAASATLKAGNFDILQNKTIQTGTTTIAAGSVVTGPTGAAVAGGKVTFSAKGVLFIANAVAGLDTLTVTANENGVLPAIGIMTNTVGKTVITATSGSASSTATITVAAVTTGGYAWTVTAPASILPGQTLKITGVLKDAYGSVVNTADVDSISVVYTGPGYVTSTIAKGTDADGAVSFSVLLGAADSGTATVKFTYGGADLIAAATVVDDVVATASITIGAAPVVAPATSAKIAGSTKRFFVSVDNNTGAKNVVVKVAGKTFRTLKGSATAKSYAVAAPKGKHKVTVFVGGKLIATRTVTVK